MARTIAAKVLIDWDFNGVYTEETGRLVTARGAHKLAPPGQSITGSGGIISQMTVELDNSDNRYSPLIAAGALYAQISGGQMYRVPVQIQVAIDGGAYEGLFVGVLKLPRNRTLTPGQAKTIQLDARGNEEKLLNIRWSTEQLNFQAYHQYGLNEADLIRQILVDDLGLDPAEVAIGPGTTPIPYFWLDDESPIEACWRLAAAAGGRFYCGKGGLFTYEPPTHWLTATRSNTSQATLTRADFESLTLYYDDAELSSRVKATVNVMDFAEDGELWAAGDPIVVAPGTNETITAELNAAAYHLDALTYTARSAGGADLTADVSIVRTDYAQRVKLVITNSNAILPAVISNLVITGVSVEIAERVAVEKVSADPFWDVANPNRKPDSLSKTISNPWVQTKAQGEALAQFVLDRQQTPALFAAIEGTPGATGRRLGDRVTVNDSELQDGPLDFYVIGIDWSYSAQAGFRQNLLGIAADGLYPYAGEYFILGASTLAGGDRLFY